jgi:post-segregation antitoxin (ccd killing protein)
MAPKKTTSVTLAEPLLAEAKALGINVSQAAEEGAYSGDGGQLIRG